MVTVLSVFDVNDTLYALQRITHVFPFHFFSPLHGFASRRYGDARIPQPSDFFCFYWVKLSGSAVDTSPGRSKLHSSLLN